MYPVLLAIGLIAQVSYPSSLHELIGASSARYGVDPTVVAGVIKCESSFDPLNVGDEGLAHGLAQINSRWHPEIPREVAENPSWAIDYLAKGISEGKGKQWTCYRMIMRDPLLSIR